VKEDPANNPADIVVTILVELTSSTPTSATYGPDPNFDPVLGTSRWWWRLGSLSASGTTRRGHVQT